MKKKFTTILFIAFLLLVKTNIIYAQVNIQDSLALVDLYNSTNGPNWTNHTNWLTNKPVSKWYGVSQKNGRVSEIQLNYNGLLGQVPSSIGDLTNLTVLSFIRNVLDGSISTSLGNLVNLTSLNFSDNFLTGSIPSSLGNLINLTSLNLSRNYLSGTIPNELSNLKKIRILYLNSNQLTGIIPNELLNLPNKDQNGIIGYIFAFNNNGLSGTIPEEFGNLTGMFSLDLSYNQFTGSIPKSFNNVGKTVTSQITFNFSHNKLSGKLINFSNLPKGSYLFIDHNHFTFAGMAKLVRRFEKLKYPGQANIPMHINGNVLSVYTGGEYQLEHDTFKWYKDGSLVATIKHDSTFTPTENGKYNVVVTNSIATKLTLYSDTINYTVSDDLIASKMNNNSSISLYPNPAKTNATISFYADGKYSITVTDLSGKTLQTKTGIAVKGTNNIQIDVSKYASGVYLITIVDEKNKKQTLRLEKE